MARSTRAPAFWDSQFLRHAHDVVRVRGPDPPGGRHSRTHGLRAGAVPRLRWRLVRGRAGAAGRRRRHLAATRPHARGAWRSGGIRVWLSVRAGSPREALGHLAEERLFILIGGAYGSGAGDLRSG